MAKWIQKTHVPVTASGTSASIEFTPATEGNFLMVVAAGSTSLSIPAGWTLESSAIGDGVLYVWYKTATAGENNLTTIRTDADEPIMAVVYEFPSDTDIIASSPQVNHNVTGIPVTGLSDLSASEKLLIHAGQYYPSDPGVTVDHIYIDPGGLPLDTWEQASYIRLLVGYDEDSTVTSWVPTVFFGNTIGGTFHWNTQRMTVALSVGAGPEPPAEVHSGLFMLTDAGKVEIPPLQMRP